MEREAWESETTDKRGLLYVGYSRTSLGLKEERNSDTSYDTNEPGRHYAKGNKPVTKRQMLYGSAYVKYPEESNSERQRVEWWPPRLGEGRRKNCLMGIVSVLKHEKNSGDWLHSDVNVLNVTKLYI